MEKTKGSFTIRKKDPKEWPHQGVEWVVSGTLPDGYPFSRPATWIEVELWLRLEEIRKKEEREEYLRRLRA